MPRFGPVVGDDAANDWAATRTGHIDLVHEAEVTIAAGVIKMMTCGRWWRIERRHRFWLPRWVTHSGGAEYETAVRGLCPTEAVCQINSMPMFPTRSLSRSDPVRVDQAREHSGRQSSQD